MDIIRCFTFRMCLICIAINAACQIKLARHNVYFKSSVVMAVWMIFGTTTNTM